jgi:hypothetical protein
MRIHKNNNKNTKFSKLNRSTQNRQPYIYIYIYIYKIIKNCNQKDIKEYDKPKTRIIGKLHMIYISSNNVRHPITKTFTTLQYTFRHFTSSHLNFTQLHYTTLSFDLTTFKFLTAPLHLTSPHFTSLHYTSPHFTRLHLTSLHCTCRWFLPHIPCTWLFKQRTHCYLTNYVRQDLQIFLMNKRKKGGFPKSGPECGSFPAC